ncbi:MAG: prolyl oligopeptidase family serine peptidase, partial [Anaerolineales bacterium]
MKTPHYSIQQFLNIRSAYFPNFSPSGDRLAFLTDITGTPQVWQVGLDLEGHKILWPDQVTFGDERVFGAWFCPADENLLLYGRDVGGNENMQFFLLSLKEGLETALTQGYEDAMHMPGGWSPDGRSFLFAANRRHPGLFDVYVQSLEGEARLVWQNPRPGFLGNMAFSPDGMRITVTRMASSSQSDLFEIDLETGAETRLSPTEGQVMYEWTAYDPDGHALLLITDLGSDFLYLARFDLATKKYTPLVQVDADVENALLSPDGKRIVYALNRGGVSEIHLLDLATGQDRVSPAITSGPGMLMGMPGVDCLVFSPDGNHLAIAFTAANVPANVYLWDLSKDEVYPATRSAAAGIEAESFAAPELVHFPTFDTDPQTGETRLIPAWLYKPKGASGELPVVVDVHGGPEGQFRPNFRPVEQYLVHQGYAVLAPNVRGSMGYGNAYGHLDDVRKRMDSVADLAHAAHWLKA